MRRSGKDQNCSKCGRAIPKGSPNFYFNPRATDNTVSCENCKMPPWYNRETGKIEKSEDFKDFTVETVEKFGGTCKSCGESKTAGVTKVKLCNDGRTWIHTYCEDKTDSSEEIKAFVPTVPSVPTVPTIPTVEPVKPTVTLQQIQDPITSVIWKSIEPLIAEKLKSVDVSDEKIRQLENTFLDLLNNQTQKVEIDIRVNDSESIKLDGVFHRNLPTLIKRIQRRQDTYLSGPAGSWKSSSIKLAAEKLDLRYAYIALSVGTMPSDLFGYIAPSTLTPVMTVFRDFYINGGVLDVAELDNTNPNVFTLLNNALDNGWASFPDGMKQRHADFVAIGNGNTPLNGPTAMYPKRVQQDAASVARFRFIDWPYDEDAEEKMVLAINPKARPMLAYITELRKLAASREQQIVISPRESKKIAEDLRDGFTFVEALDANIWKCKDSIKKTLMPLVALPTVDMSIPYVEAAKQPEEN